MTGFERTGLERFEKALESFENELFLRKKPFEI